MKQKTLLNRVYLNILESAGVDIIYGFAKIIDKDKVEVNQRYYICEKILIAVGGKPYLPQIAGNEHFITSDDALELKTFPLGLK